ncbi:uncharacterized protein LOC105165701 isoform X2 [Sesamum indicum]|uniref:Uncharacterized protein LOC105165701 isoform X2 n=1 Tax=Sesamum indicum TaxID=4182 RepID=A0A6I9TJA2_SESIN|nr:uncharacterized protein LOC105165701 isoform X2 [Sesamum indicum]XP_020549821.1 uncharacterized protein LOC105165701 isoform X2 [Sesamum indicum]
MNFLKGMILVICFRLSMNFHQNCSIVCCRTCLHWHWRSCTKTCHLTSEITLNMLIITTEIVENEEGWEERYGILDSAWEALYKVRWPCFSEAKQCVGWLDKYDEAKYQSVDDWQQMYWEAHLQDCVDAVAETALLPSYDGSIGEIQIPDAILEHIGCKGHLIKLTPDYLKFSNHCQQFGVYARQLRLPNALCVAETCDLLENSKLGSLELQWIKSNDHVEGLCKLLNQNSETLKSVDFIHCKLSPTFISAICDSLHVKGLRAHGVQHFSIKRSSFLQTDSSPVPVGLTSFLTSGSSLHSVTLCDDQLGRNFARVIINSLLDSAASISTLDLSENNITGFLSHFRWRSSSCSLGIGKSLKSLQVLNLRSCNLVREDADCLKQALVHMPNLQNLDLSDNSIEDGVRSLISYFREISSRDLPFSDLMLENCELTCNQVIELLGVLSTMKKPVNLLSIKGNRLGSEIGAPFGKFLCTGVRAVDVEDIGLGSSGFLEALREISTELKIAYINISNNQGGIEAAKFMSSIISHSQKIVAIDARYNLMPMESLSVISSGMKASKGKLEHLDLAGNSFCDHLADAASVLAELQIHGQSALSLSLWAAPSAPYDDDP